MEKLILYGTGGMKGINTICGNPGCDKDIMIPGAKIKRAVMRRGYTKGLALVPCPECAHVMKLPEDMPTKPDMLEQYIVEFEESGNYLDCIPFLDSMNEVLPAGFEIRAGTTLYRPGGGGKLLDKYAYMVKYGIDPETAYNMGKVAKEPFKITNGR